MFVSCGNDPIDYQAALEPLTDAGPELTFGTDNEKTVKVSLEDPATTVISVYRNKTDVAESYPIMVLTNDENVFTVPQTVNFEAGSNKAEITVDFNNAEADKSYTLKLGFNETDMDKFSLYTNYVYTVVRKSIKKGQWLDGMYGFWCEVIIEQDDENPNIYRIKNPYTEDIAKEYIEGWFSSGYSFGTDVEPYLEFTLKEDGGVSWETPIGVNLSYKGVNLKGYYPSQLGSKYASYDAESYAEFNEENGNIEYFLITPLWYWNKSMGDWGADYYCALAFPGVDLATEWEW